MNGLIHSKVSQYFDRKDMHFGHRILTKITATYLFFKQVTHSYRLQWNTHLVVLRASFYETHVSYHDKSSSMKTGFKDSTKLTTWHTGRTYTFSQNNTTWINTMKGLTLSEKNYTKMHYCYSIHRMFILIVVTTLNNQKSKKRLSIHCL